MRVRLKKQQIFKLVFSLIGQSNKVIENSDTLRYLFHKKSTPKGVLFFDWQKLTCVIKHHATDVTDCLRWV